MFALDMVVFFHMLIYLNIQVRILFG